MDSLAEKTGTSLKLTELSPLDWEKVESINFLLAIPNIVV